MSNTDIQYRQDDAPRYTTGHIATLVCVTTGLIASTAMYFLLRRENNRRDRGERDEVIRVDGGIVSGGDPKNGVYESIEEAKRDKGDDWSGYRYII